MLTIINDLEKDHARFRRYLTLYQAEIEKMKSGVGANFSLLEHLAEYFSVFPDELHHRKEDIIYDLLEAVAVDLKLPLENLHDQHLDLSTRAAHFASVVKSVLNEQEVPIHAIVEEVEAYANTLELHMAGEEDWLFEPARNHFSEQNWAVVHEAISELYAADVNQEKADRVRELELSLEDYLGDANTL